MAVTYLSSGSTSSLQHPILPRKLTFGQKILLSRMQIIMTDMYVP